MTNSDTNKEICVKITTSSGEDVLCYSSATNEKWCLEIKSDLNNRCLNSIIEIAKEENIFVEAQARNYCPELDPFEETFEENEMPPTSPVLTCLHYVDNRSNIKKNELPKKIFGGIFGRNATLMSEEVVLAGFPDGQIYFASITADNSLQNLTALANLAQPIVHIQYIKEGLLIVGYYGKLCLCLSMGAKLEFNIPSPVCSVCYFNDSLYHVSNVGNILISKFVHFELKTCETMIKNAKLIMVINENENPVLVYASKDGVLKPLNPEIERDETLKSTPPNILLENIQMHMDKSNYLKSELDFIKQRLHDVSLCAWLCANQITEIIQSCTLKIIRKEDNSYNLVISVKNLQALVLTNSWHLCCQLMEQNGSTSVCKTVNILATDVISVINVTMASLKRLTMPLKLDCSLIFGPNAKEFPKYNRIFESLFPMCFSLKTFYINEIMFLENQTIDWCEINFNTTINPNMAIKNIANARLKQIPLSKKMQEKIGTISSRNPISNSPTSFSFTFLSETLQKKFPRPLNADDLYFVRELKSYLIRNSLLPISQDAKYLYQNSQIEINTFGQLDYTHLSITSPCAVPLISIRRALMEEFSIIFPKNIASDIEEEVCVNANATEIAKNLLTKLLKISPTNRCELLELYFGIRQKLSALLPIL